MTKQQVEKENLAAGNGNGRRRTQAERRADSAEKILQAAIRAIGKEGSTRITMGDIGEDAGFSRGLPAAIFGTKDNLIVSTARSLIDAPQSNSVFSVDVDGGLDELLRIISFWFNELASEGENWRCMFVLMGECLPGVADARLPELTAAVSDFFRRARARLSELLLNAKNRGELQEDIDVEIEATLIVGVVRGVLSEWLIDQNAFDTKAVGRVYVEQLKHRLQRVG